MLKRLAELLKAIGIVDAYLRGESGASGFALHACSRKKERKINV
jgi:hypothetical protein